MISRPDAFTAKTPPQATRPQRDRLHKQARCTG